MLAAGGSTRLGRAKQLLTVAGEGLLRRSVQAALASDVCPVTVVLGAEASACGAELAGLPMRVVIHSAWRDGIASSIVAGMRDLRRLDPDLDAVVIMVCDQPHLTPGIINALIETHETLGKGIVASAYAGVAGVPALFAKQYFGAISRLTGDHGARSLFALAPSDVARIAFADGGVDIDTEADYEQMVRSSFNSRQRGQLLAQS